MKRILITICLVAATVALSAQDYSRIDKMLQQNRYTDAYNASDTLRREALEKSFVGKVDTHLSRQLLTATWYMERAAIHYQEDVKDSSRARFRAILPYLTPVDRTVCYIFLDNIDSALADTLALRNVKNTQIAAFCTPPENARFNTTPTMYDLVMQLAINNVPLQRKITFQRQLVEWYRQQPATKENTRLLLYNELDLLYHLYSQPNKPHTYKKRLTQECLNRYRNTGDEQLARLYCRLATLCEADSDYLAALAYCDSAIARWPKSRGGMDCANVRREILVPVIETDIEEVSPAGRDILMKVTARNASTLHYRVIAFPQWYPDYNLSDSAKRAKLAAEKTLKRWSQELSGKGMKPDHKYYQFYGYIPQLAPGHYMLLVSPSGNFSVQGFRVQSFTVSAATFVLMDVDQKVTGYVVDYVTGAPVANQKVHLQRSHWDDKFTTVTTATTDAEGFFSIEKKYNKKASDWYQHRLLTQYKGLDVVAAVELWNRNNDTLRTDHVLFLDRPVYKPGDTLQFMLIASRIAHNRDGQTLAGESLRIELRDVNFNVIDTLYGVTDGYGSLSGRFVIPSHALPGWFSLMAYPSIGHKAMCRKSFNVEAYKQPKFTVTLNQQGSGGLGDTLVVEGLAASYTQVPVGGAKVVYSITRSQILPWWRRWKDAKTLVEPQTIASDSLATDAEGLFRIAFLAEPDSNADLSSKPIFSYDVQVDVTDINGETHSQSLRLLAGNEDSYISLSLPWQVTELGQVAYTYCNLGNTPLKGYVNLTVERLRQPQSPWIAHPQLQPGVRHTLSETEFHQRFPLTPYTYKEEQVPCWPVEKKVFDTRVMCEGLTQNNIVLPKMAPGIYRLCIATDGGVADTAVVVYTPQGNGEVYGTQILWSDISTSEAHVGDTVVLRLGSRLNEVWATYQMVCRSEAGIEEHRLLRADNGIATLRIPVTEAMLGGFDINLCAVKEGRSELMHYRVEVPFKHKKLEIQIATFRDKLTPGEKENWTITIKHNLNNIHNAAALLLGMYDAALDSYGYGKQSFSWFPWRNNSVSIAQGATIIYPWKYSGRMDLLIPQPFLYYHGKDPQGWTFTALSHRSWQWRRAGIRYEQSSTARGENGMVTLQGNLRQRKAAKGSPDVLNEIAVVEDEAEEVFLVVEDAGGTGSSGSNEKPYIRTDLSTLAFFEPTLRTDSDGTMIYMFTAPDLLTRWNVEGLAWTQELSTGHLQRQLITRKELMIQPNMPRFLREGDTATLMAKVMNLTDSTLSVKVDFSFEIPPTPTAPANSQLSTLNSQFLSVPPHGTMPVEFTVTVPVGGTVATYKYVATAAHYSDGEQGPLPLLTNRQAVTTSMSMYLNGSGSKQYTLTLPSSPTAQPVSFTVEYTANPIWLAIQSLPYLSECSNPSNIYLASSYYVNTIGKQIADQYPSLKHYADNVTDEESPLVRNADIKQTLLDETPWLRAGTSEVEQKRQIARYYNTKELERICSETLDKLKKEQRGDGGWSWMPGGKYSSTYVTQYILKNFGILSRQIARSNTPMETKALTYIDKEAYKDYLEWQKHLAKHPGSQCRPIMLDYLYTRSYYRDHKFASNHREAFDYYYRNAKERYADYTSLYDQALLALVFHRNGDKKLAREMVERIRQKALYSDEMGMYWRDNRAGWYFYQRPIETQALLIETFREVTPDDTSSIGQMQQWLLKQKQTTRWNSDIATLRAIQALMPNNNLNVTVDLSRSTVALSVHGKALDDTLRTPAGSGSAGYLHHTYRADSLAALTTGHSVAVTVSSSRSTRTPSWGALYYQYTEQMDKIAASETGITLRRTLYRVEPDGTLTELKGSASLHVGDRLRVRLEVACDRNLEYVELKEFRASCLEPVSTASGWVWSSGLSYYVAVNNSHNAVYIDRLEKGKYLIDSDYYVTNSGTFTLAPSVLQCLYAPEFRATSAGQRLVTIPF